MPGGWRGGVSAVPEPRGPQTQRAPSSASAGKPPMSPGASRPGVGNNPSLGGGALSPSWPGKPPLLFTEPTSHAVLHSRRPGGAGRGNDWRTVVIPGERQHAPRREVDNPSPAGGGAPGLQPSPPSPSGSSSLRMRSGGPGGPGLAALGAAGEQREGRFRFPLGFSGAAAERDARGAVLLLRGARLPRPRRRLRPQRQQGPPPAPLGPAWRPRCRGGGRGREGSAGRRPALPLSRAVLRAALLLCAPLACRL